MNIDPHQKIYQSVEGGIIVALVSQRLEGQSDLSDQDKHKIHRFNSCLYYVDGDPVVLKVPCNVKILLISVL